MKPGSANAVVQAQPAPSLLRGGDFIFPERATPARLRAIRDRLMKRGWTAEALRVARRLAEVDPGRESCWKRGLLERQSGQYRRALKTLRDGLRYDKGAAYILPEIHIQLAAVWYTLEDSKRMGESLRRAYALRPKQRSEPNLHLSFGNFYLSRRKWRDALREFGSSERASVTPLQRARALGNQAVALWNLRELEAACRRMDRAIEFYKASGHQGGLIWARRIRATFYLDQGQVPRALGMVERAIPGAERIGQAEELPGLLANAGYLAGELGDWEGSLKHLDRALEVLKSVEQRQTEATVLALRATALAHLEQHDASSRSLAAAQRLARGCRHWVLTLHLCRAEARIAALRGDWFETRRRALSAERLALKVNDRPRIVEFRTLRGRAEAELGRSRAALHAKRSVERLASLSGQASLATRRLQKSALRLAKSALPVLLQGAAGTGKTRLAKEIHLAGPRAKGPCVVAPCEQLAFPASDLCGHKAGAWSGAKSDSEGLVGRAEGGTLILDRVDELKPADQRALTDLVEGRVRPVGGTEERRVNVRILATCRDARLLVPELRVRLAGALLELRPLEERREDIPALVRALLPVDAPITSDALALLARHPWPGNLAELEAKLELLTSQAKGPLGVKAVRAVLAPRKTDRVERARRRLDALAEALK